MSYPVDVPKSLDLNSDPVTWIRPLCDHCHLLTEHIDIGLSQRINIFCGKENPV